MKEIVFISAVCGVGKSTTLDYIKQNNLIHGCDIFDIDDLINIHEYENEKPTTVYSAAVEKAVSQSTNKNIIIGSCANPVEMKQVNIPNSAKSIEMILIYCSNEELIKRLKARDENRNCGSDEFINGQIEYQKYMLDHSDLFKLKIDNTNIDVSEVSNRIVDYIRNREEKENEFDR